MKKISVVKYFYIRKLYYNETNGAYIYRSFNRVWALEIMTRGVFIIIIIIIIMFKTHTQRILSNDLTSNHFYRERRYRLN